jgi:hypothetical protein
VAPIGVAWMLLTDFAGWGNFHDVRTWVDPPRPADVGERMRDDGRSDTRHTDMVRTMLYGSTRELIGRRAAANSM